MLLAVLELLFMSGYGLGKRGVELGIECESPAVVCRNVGAYGKGTQQALFRLRSLRRRGNTPAVAPQKRELCPQCIAVVVVGVAGQNTSGVMRDKVLFQYLLAAAFECKQILMQQKVCLTQSCVKRNAGESAGAATCLVPALKGVDIPQPRASATGLVALR